MSLCALTEGHAGITADLVFGPAVVLLLLLHVKVKSNSQEFDLLYVINCSLIKLIKCFPASRHMSPSLVLLELC